jgi:hypothetical protein
MSSARLGARASGILIDEPEKPPANIIPRKKSDEYENGGHNSTFVTVAAAIADGV